MVLLKSEWDKNASLYAFAGHTFNHKDYFSGIKTYLSKT